MPPAGLTVSCLGCARVVTTALRCPEMTAAAEMLSLGRDPTGSGWLGRGSQDSQELPQDKDRCSAGPFMGTQRLAGGFIHRNSSWRMVCISVDHGHRVWEGSLSLPPADWQPKQCGCMPMPCRRCVWGEQCTGASGIAPGKGVVVLSVLRDPVSSEYPPVLWDMQGPHINTMHEMNSRELSCEQLEIIW